MLSAGAGNQKAKTLERGGGRAEGGARGGPRGAGRGGGAGGAGGWGGRAGGGQPTTTKNRKDRENRIVFSARTDDDIDGFDFKADDHVTDLRFLLEIDGKQFPRLVVFGRDNQKATGIPLTVRLR